MNLKENYERLFGKMETMDRLGHTQPTNKTVPVKLTESEISKWNKIHRAFQSTYPSRALTQRYGSVYIDDRLVENVAAFLKLDNKTIVNKIKSTVQKLRD